MRFTDHHHVFRSGTNIAAEIEATYDAGWQVGVAAPRLHQAEMKVLQEASAHFERALFADSGAFGEIDRNTFAVVRPITDDQWSDIFRTYTQLAVHWRERFLFVAPDRVGDQTVTLDRLRQHEAPIRGVSECGARAVVALQSGELPMRAMCVLVRSLFAGMPFVWGVPSKVNATTDENMREALSAIAEMDASPHIHLLGVAPGLDAPNALYLQRLKAVTDILPHAYVTCDSVRRMALVGNSNGPGGKPREITRQERVLRRRGHDPQMGKYLSTRNVYRSELHRVAFANRNHGTFNLMSIPGMPSVTVEEDQ